MEHLLPQTTGVEVIPTGKIVVFAGNSLKANEIFGLGKDFGLSKDRFEVYDYESAKSYDYSKLEWTGNICALLMNGQVVVKDGK